MQLQFVSFGTDFITARMRTKVPLPINTLILLLTTKRKKKLISIQILLMGITFLLPLSEHQFSPLSAMDFCFGLPLVMTVNKNYSVNHMTPYMLCRKKKHGKNPIASVVCNSAGGTVNNHTALSSDLQVAKYIKKKGRKRKNGSHMIKVYRLS